MSRVYIVHHVADFLQSHISNNNEFCEEYCVWQLSIYGSLYTVSGKCQVIITDAVINTPGFAPSVSQMAVFIFHRHLYYEKL